jgi:hypothetical protein
VFLYLIALVLGMQVEQEIALVENSTGENGFKIATSLPDVTEIVVRNIAVVLVFNSQKPTV